MELKTLEYVEWNDLQKEICDEMGIKMEDFRNYHNVVGGTYKDLWHVWLWYIDHRMYNDSIMPTSMGDILDHEWLTSELKKNGFDDWGIPFLEVTQGVFEKYSTQYTTLHIRYYW